MMRYLRSSDFVRTQDINGRYLSCVMLGWFSRSYFSIKEFPGNVKADFPRTPAMDEFVMS